MKPEQPVLDVKTTHHLGIKRDRQELEISSICTNGIELQGHSAGQLALVGWADIYA